jgi:hypothetical protein
MTGLENLLLITFLVLIGLAVATSALIIAYVLSCHVLGRTAGAIVRHTRPVTELERRRVAADERAARDNTRPHGQLIDISPVAAPNGHDSFFEDPA